MINSAFDLGEELNNRTVRYILHLPLWNGFNYPNINLDFSNWISIKYLNNTGTALNTLVSSVPNNSGGLYIFYIKCPIIGGLTEYPLYIGRAQLSSSQNLRKRVKEYFQHYLMNDERPKITRMIKYWGSELYLAYYPVASNQNIINLEADIINSTLFAMNDQIPDQIISQAVKAFSL